MTHTNSLVRGALSLAFGIVLAGFVLPARAGAQRGSGAPYGARDARQCKVPAPRGAPSAEQAAQAFICNNEKEDGRNLWLVGDVRVQVGSGRRFLYSSDAFEDIDPAATVYPIRGSLVSYVCGRQANILSGQDPKRLCFHMDQRNASGICFTTTFKDLRCTLLDMTSSLDTQHPLPPPGAK